MSEMSHKLDGKKTASLAPGIHNSDVSSLRAEPPSTAGTFDDAPQELYHS